MRIKIWFIRFERTLLKEDKKREDFTEVLLKNSIERVLNLIRFIERKISSILQEIILKKIWKQSGVYNFKQNSWIKFELLAKKF